MAYIFTNVKDARKYFNAEIKPLVEAKYGKGDIPALDQAFNDWIDSLHKDGAVPDRSMGWCRN